MAALPRTFDHVPQDLWERAIIARIGKREEGRGKRHDWATGCGGHEQSWTRNNMPPLSGCQGIFAKNASLDSQNAKLRPQNAKMHARTAKYAQMRKHSFARPRDKSSPRSEELQLKTTRRGQWALPLGASGCLSIRSICPQPQADPPKAPSR